MPSKDYVSGRHSPAARWLLLGQVTETDYACYTMQPVMPETRQAACRGSFTTGCARMHVLAKVLM